MTIRHRRPRPIFLPQNNMNCHLFFLLKFWIYDSCVAQKYILFCTIRHNRTEQYFSVETNMIFTFFFSPKFWIFFPPKLRHDFRVAETCTLFLWWLGTAGLKQYSYFEMTWIFTFFSCQSFEFMILASCKSIHFFARLSIIGLESLRQCKLQLL